MSRSYRDQKPKHLAKRKLGVKKTDKKPLPRIIVRKPRLGDVHPIEARALRGALRVAAPLEYLYGLTKIELRARQDNEIGNPYGYYNIVEKSIVLYSLPMQWRKKFISKTNINLLRRYYASVVKDGSEFVVTWKSKALIANWFFYYVVAHELGHHYRNQYKISLGSKGARRHEEWVADMHANRIESAFWRQIRAKWEKVEPELNNQ